MKNLLGILILLWGVPLASAGGLEKGTSTHGGETLDVNGVPVLRDLVDKTTCEWMGYEEFVTRVRHWPTLLASIEKTHWYLPIIMEEELRRLDFCVTQGELMHIPTEDVDGVTVHEEGANQVAIRINHDVYVSEKFFEPMSDENKSYTLAHEVMHGLIQLHEPRRNNKLRSMIKMIKKNAESPMSPEHFGYQLRKNGIQVASDVHEYFEFKDDVLKIMQEDAKSIDGFAAAVRLKDSSVIQLLNDGDRKSIEDRITWANKRIWQAMEENDFALTSALVQAGVDPNHVLLPFVARIGQATHSGERNPRAEEILMKTLLAHPKLDMATTCSAIKHPARTVLGCRGYTENSFAPNSVRHANCLLSDTAISCAMRYGLEELVNRLLDHPKFDPKDNRNTKSNLFGYAVWNPKLSDTLFNRILAIDELQMDNWTMAANLVHGAFGSSDENPRFSTLLADSRFDFQWDELYKENGKLKPGYSSLLNQFSDDKLRSRDLLLEAIRNQKTEMVQYLIEKTNYNLNVKISRGYSSFETLISLAVRAGRKDYIKLALQRESFYFTGHDIGWIVDDRELMQLVVKHKNFDPNLILDYRQDKSVDFVERRQISLFSQLVRLGSMELAKQVVQHPKWSSNDRALTEWSEFNLPIETFSWILGKIRTLGTRFSMEYELRGENYLYWKVRGCIGRLAWNRYSRNQSDESLSHMVYLACTETGLDRKIKSVRMYLEHPGVQLEEYDVYATYRALKKMRRGLGNRELNRLIQDLKKKWKEM